MLASLAVPSQEPEPREKVELEAIALALLRLLEAVPSIYLTFVVHELSAGRAALLRGMLEARRIVDTHELELPRPGDVDRN